MAPSPISAGARSGYTDAIPANLAAVTMVDFGYSGIRWRGELQRLQSSRGDLVVGLTL
jgi:hypothetical protein